MVHDALRQSKRSIIEVKTKEARKNKKKGIQRNNMKEKKGSMSTRGQTTFEKVAAFDERRTSTLDAPGLSRNSNALKKKNNKERKFVIIY